MIYMQTMGSAGVRQSYQTAGVYQGDCSRMLPRPRPQFRGMQIGVRDFLGATKWPMSREAADYFTARTTAGLKFSAQMLKLATAQDRARALSTNSST